MTVLGYGNVAFGALDVHASGVSHLRIRTKRTNRARVAAPHYAGSDLIINGIDGRDDPGSYIVTNEDLGSVIRPGVIVDLVGGRSASNRGAGGNRSVSARRRMIPTLSSPASVSRRSGGGR